MSFLEPTIDDVLGRVISVDTATVTVKVDNLEKLKRLQVNRLAILQSSRAGQKLVGIVQKITRSSKILSDEIDIQEPLLDTKDNEINLVKISLIGTYKNAVGSTKDVFSRTLDTVPEIEAYCYPLEGDSLTKFMQVISSISGDGNPLSLGCYTLDENAKAFINGNKFFQRHAIIVGSTGSGKSWTTAKLLEQIAKLQQANSVVFDIHGEYAPLVEKGFSHFKVAGPKEVEAGASLEKGIIYLPYWLLGYEALISMFVDRSDDNAPNQSMIMSRTVTGAKRKFLESLEQTEILNSFTIDSPVPFNLNEVMEEIVRLDSEMVPGSNNKDKQGPYHGKLTRLIGRLQNKQTDRRLGFLFSMPEEVNQLDWLNHLVKAVLSGSKENGSGGVKIINFSEVPSDILPLMVSLVAKLIFSIHQWTNIDVHNRLQFASLYPFIENLN